MKFFIKGQVPSSKNAKQWTGRRLINNKRVLDYYNNFSEQLINIKDQWLEQLNQLTYPVKLNMQFVRQDRRIFDYINPAQTIQDGLVKNEFIPDDNYNYIIPVFHNVIIDKDNPGVYLWLEQ